MIIIGLDGLTPEMVLKFAHEGIIPNMKKIMDRGVFSFSLPVPETATATNWATLSTGCWSGTHCIDSFATHIPGKSFRNYYKFCVTPPRPTSAKGKNKEIKVETLWEAAKRQDKKILLINWPFTWPPPIRNGVIVTETGPSSHLADLYGALEYNTHLKIKDKFHVKLRLKSW